MTARSSRDSANITRWNWGKSVYRGWKHKHNVQGEEHYHTTRWWGRWEIGPTTIKRASMQAERADPQEALPAKRTTREKKAMTTSTRNPGMLVGSIRTKSDN
jgi:hypothetical protein